MDKAQNSRRTRAKRKISNMRGLIRDFKKEGLSSLLIIFFAVVVIGGSLVFLAERLMQTGEYHSPLDALWWGIVTLTTVGYGDYAPQSILARVFAILMMLSGVVITSILSGTIASIYVDRKIREGKGLQNIVIKDHILICGWNRYGKGLIESFLRQYISETLNLVIISEMSSEDFESLRISFPDLEIRFLRGDIANETVLQRANLKAARSCIIIPDESGGKTFLAADDKTILAALAIKSINPELHITAQIVHDQSTPHLQRAQVDEIIYGDEIIRHIVSSSTIVHGLPSVINMILDPDSSHRLTIQKIPSDLVGKTFAEYSTNLVQANAGVCIGFLSEVKTTSLIDILSEDTSGIDAFIKKKFSEAEIDLEKEQDTSLEISLVPNAKYIIKPNDSAFVLGGKL